MNILNLPNDQMDSMVLEVLESYAVATPDGNDPRILEDWIRRHPKFSQELMDFAASRDLQKFPVDDEIGEDEEQRFLARSRAAYEKLLAKRHGTRLESLTKRAEELQLKKGAFARQLGISVSLLMYLEKRRLQFRTIPRALISRIAEALRVAPEQVAAFLDQRQNFATEANFKAERRPEEMPPKSFIEAVNEDLELTPDQKRALVSMIKD